MTYRNDPLLSYRALDYVKSTKVDGLSELFFPPAPPAKKTPLEEAEIAYYIAVKGFRYALEHRDAVARSLETAEKTLIEKADKLEEAQDDLTVQLRLDALKDPAAKLEKVRAIVKQHDIPSCRMADTAGFILDLVKAAVG